MDKTPLHFASCMGHFEIVEFLLNNGANVDAEMFNGETPLLIAAWYARDGKYETMKALLEHGANVNHKDKHGRTALHNAAMYSGKEVINLLISYGADVNAIDEFGRTPLIAATKQNNTEAASEIKQYIQTIEDEKQKEKEPQ